AAVGSEAKVVGGVGSTISGIGVTRGVGGGTVAAVTGVGTAPRTETMVGIAVAAAGTSVGGFGLGVGVSAEPARWIISVIRGSSVGLSSRARLNASSASRVRPCSYRAI